MSPDVQRELFRQSLQAIQTAVDENLTCKHSPENGSDDPCDGEDCLRCYVLSLTKPALEGG